LWEAPSASIDPEPDKRTRPGSEGHDISMIMDAMAVEAAEWQLRPLEAM
jgi:hypothetical protein